MLPLSCTACTSYKKITSVHSPYHKITGDKFTCIELMCFTQVSHIMKKSVIKFIIIWTMWETFTPSQAMKVYEAMYLRALIRSHTTSWPSLPPTKQ